MVFKVRNHVTTLLKHDIVKHQNSNTLGGPVTTGNQSDCHFLARESITFFYQTRTHWYCPKNMNQAWRRKKRPFIKKSTAFWLNFIWIRIRWKIVKLHKDKVQSVVFKWFQDKMRSQHSRQVERTSDSKQALQLRCSTPSAKHEKCFEHGSKHESRRASKHSSASSCSLSTRGFADFLSLEPAGSEFGRFWSFLEDVGRFEESSINMHAS